MATSEPDAEAVIEQIAAHVAAAGLDDDVEVRLHAGRVDVLVAGRSVEAALRLDGEFAQADAIAAYQSGGDWGAYADAVIAALR